MVGVSASVNLPLHKKVQKFSGTSSPGWSGKKGRKTVVALSGNYFKPVQVHYMFLRIPEQSIFHIRCQLKGHSKSVQQR